MNPSRVCVAGVNHLSFVCQRNRSCFTRGTRAGCSVLVREEAVDREVIPVTDYEQNQCGSITGVYLMWAGLNWATTVGSVHIRDGRC